MQCIVDMFQVDFQLIILRQRIQLKQEEGKKILSDRELSNFIQNENKQEYSMQEYSKQK